MLSFTLFSPSDAAPTPRRTEPSRTLCPPIPRTCLRYQQCKRYRTARGGGKKQNAAAGRDGTHSDISGSRRVCRRPARAAILRRGHRASPRSPIDTYYRGLQQNMWRFVPKVWRTRTPKSTYCERFPMKKGPVHLVQGCQAAVSGGSGARAPWQYRSKHACQ